MWPSGSRPVKSFPKGKSTSTQVINDELKKHAAGANVIPVIGQVLSAALTVADVTMTVIDAAQIAGDLYDLMRVRPDFTITAGGESHFGEIKLEATKDTFSPGQADAHKALNGGQKVQPLNETQCKCPK